MLVTPFGMVNSVISVFSSIYRCFAYESGLECSISPKDILHQIYTVTCDIKALYQTILEALDTYNKLGIDNVDATECGEKAALEYNEKVDRILDTHRKLLGYVLMDGDSYKYMLEKEGE